MVAALAVVFIALEALAAVWLGAVAAARVSQVQDEPIDSPQGDEIGVRVSFTLDAPSADWYSVFPSLHSSGGARGLWLSPVRGRVDGRSYMGRLQAGRHALEFVLYPGIVSLSPEGDPCLSPVEPAALPSSDEPRSPLRVEIGDTSYGATWRGGREEITYHAYSTLEMYHAVLAGGLKRCTRDN